MRSNLKEKIDIGMVTLDSTIMEEDINMMDEFEELMNLEGADMFNSMLYHYVLEWMKENKQLREQIAEEIRIRKIYKGVIK
jgi:predicted glycosyl hydrolase (DUF1957 family)